MFMRSILAIFPIISTLILVGEPAYAESYTVTVRGTVTEIRNAQSRLPSALALAQIGQPFTFRYFGQDQPDTDASPSAGRYRWALFDGPHINLLATVSVNGNVFVMPSPTGTGDEDRTLTVLNNYTVGSTGIIRDQFSSQKVSCSQDVSVCFNLIVIAYQDGSATSPPTVFNSDAFIVAPVALEAFKSQALRFYAGDVVGVRNQTSSNFIKGVISEVIVSSGVSPDPYTTAGTETKDPCIR